MPPFSSRDGAFVDTSTDTFFPFKSMTVPAEQMRLPIAGSVPPNTRRPFDRLTVAMLAGVLRMFVAPPLIVSEGMVEPAALPVIVLLPFVMERLEIVRTVVGSIQMSESLTDTVLSAEVRNGVPAWK